ncbi:MAG: carbohydrate ABC transporter permease [Pleomorphochaeta sp.]
MNQNKNAIFKAKVIPYLYLFPTALVLIIFIYYPAIKTFILAFYRSNFILGTRKFIGLENFKNLFSGVLAPGFIQTCIQTIVFSFLVVILGLSISMFLAVLTNEKIKGAKYYRLLLIWPFALSPAVAGTVFSFIFNPEVGVINIFLSSVFNVKPGWLTNPYLAFFVAVFAAVWKNLGYNIVFYIAAFQNISKDPLEAAEIDGASRFSKFIHILFPLLSPTTFFLLFTNITYSLFDSFAIVDVLTKGGPMGPSPYMDNLGLTTTLMYKIFLDGFGGSSNMGFAASETFVLMIIVMFITMFQFGFLGKKVNYDV